MHHDSRCPLLWLAVLQPALWTHCLGEFLRYLSFVRPGIFILVFHFINLICALKPGFCLLTQSNNSVTLTAMARAQEICINQLKCQPWLIKELAPLSQSKNSMSI